MTVIGIACAGCATEFSFVVAHTPKVVWCPVCGLWQRLVAVPAQPRCCSLTKGTGVACCVQTWAKRTEWGRKCG